MKELPTSIDSNFKNYRAPYMSDKQAIGWKGHVYIEYVIVRELFGQSDESGETLYSIEVEKTEQILPEGSPFGPTAGFPKRTLKKMYINSDGDAFPSWKGKLKNNPICNFHRGVVYYC